MTIPRILYAYKTVNGVLLASEKLSDFENLRDEPIGVYELKGKERLTIGGPGKAEEKGTDGV